MSRRRIFRRDEEKRGRNYDSTNWSADRLNGCANSEAEPAPKLYRMRIFAVNPVVARSRLCVAPCCLLTAQPFDEAHADPVHSSLLTAGTS